MLKIWVVQLFEESSENLVDGGGRACKGGYSPTKGHQPSTWKRTKIFNPLQQSCCHTALVLDKCDQDIQIIF